jgi:hypothetical protein
LKHCIIADVKPIWETSGAILSGGVEGISGICTPKADAKVRIGWKGTVSRRAGWHYAWNNLVYRCIQTVAESTSCRSMHKWDFSCRNVNILYISQPRALYPESRRANILRVGYR